MKQQITGTTTLIGLIAKPIKHSISPIIHNCAFNNLNLDYAYLAFEIDQNQVEDAIKGLKALNARGCNISMPYKQLVIPHLDFISKEASLIGAVNTIVNDHGILKGYNTDGIGMIESLKDQGLTITNKKLTIVGAGGAATAIIVQGALDGFKEIVIYNKKDNHFNHALELVKKLTSQTNCIITVKELNDLNQLKEDLNSSNYFINATNVGMAELENITYIPDQSFFHPELVVIDVIYNPKETQLLKLAKLAHCKTFNGLGMLLYQAAAAFELWTGQKMPIDIIKKEIQLD